jgi:hypothetical protein
LPETLELPQENICAQKMVAEIHHLCVKTTSDVGIGNIMAGYLNSQLHGNGVVTHALQQRQVWHWPCSLIQKALLN